MSEATQQWLVPGALVALLLLALVLLVLILNDRRRTRRELAEARREAAELRDRVDGLAVSRSPAGRVEGSQEFVITGVPDGAAGELLPARADETEAVAAPPVHVGRIDGRLFADIVLRETLVKAAAVAGGVRRALDPATRNRIRFEMSREVKRSRKQRRAELRAARRLLQEQQRADIDMTEAARDSGEDAA